MARDTHTIHGMFDALQEQFGAFPAFEDVPPAVLEAEIADEARLAGAADLVTDAVAQFTALSAARRFVPHRHRAAACADDP